MLAWLKKAEDDYLLNNTDAKPDFCIQNNVESKSNDSVDPTAKNA